MDLNFNALGRDVSEAGCDARLLTGPLYIGSLGLHVEAIRVEKDVDFVQRAYHELHDPSDDSVCSCAEQLDALYNLDPEGPFETTTIDGREGEWVIFATPCK